MNRQEKWDRRFLDMAVLVGSWSKDPSTKTGAVIVDSDNRVVSVGYNGLPQKITDNPEKLLNRELKYQIIVHCERNALIFAEKSVKNCTLYTIPFLSCSVCASMMIQAGISRVVAPFPKSKDRYGDVELPKELFREAEVEVVEMEYQLPFTWA